ncbi:DUF1963 domain-containing protein [Curtobacterium luteum]|uniref:DUF1963 domain-containing protein n=1 Tax=Curtobacterium luteum TaxID=33881 RepID=UPI00073712AA|nr:DUF1963 domain-containing protein [Curtobacterium luteum]
MSDVQQEILVEVDTEAAARARWNGPRNPWPAVFVTAWILAVFVFVAVSVYENAWRHHDVATSFWIGAAWAVPLLIVVHATHAVCFRRGGPLARRQDAVFRRAADRVLAAARAAGMPELDEGGVLRMLRARDNGPDPGTGERGGPDRPLLRWDLPLAGRGSRTIVVAERIGTAEPGGSPERTRLTSGTRPGAVAHPGAARPVTRRTHDSSAGAAVLGAYRSDSPAPITASRIGGAPAVPRDWEWPTCAEHDEPMQFTAQIEHRGTLVSVFVCQFDPGSCDSWDADSGANAAFVFSGRDLVSADRPVSPHGDPDDPDPAYPPLLADSMLLGTAPVTDAGDDTVSAALDAAGAVVAGQYGGEPDWLQEDETPAGLAFVASIESGPLGFDFGDAGRAYVFSDGVRAAVLWQCT